MFESKQDFMDNFQKTLIEESSKDFADTSPSERYHALVTMVACQAEYLGHETGVRYMGRRRVYYFSMEFLIGRLLYSYLLNLGVLKVVQEGLQELGTDLDTLIEQERDPGLGSGGLGRLAACYLDSMAYLDLPGYGYGLFYRYGLFQQKIVNGYQVERPDAWLSNGYPWATKRPEKAITVRFGGHVTAQKAGERYRYTWVPDQEVLAVPYEIPIVGYGGKAVNRLTLWSAQPTEDILDLEAFNRGDYGYASRYRAEIEALTQILYPNDATEAGQRLRLKQEYLMVAAGLGDIVRHYRKDHGTDVWDQLPQHVAIHINDTHPTLCAPELMRILMDEEGLSWESAWSIVTATLSYTNHTILPEALEMWPIDMLRSILPRIYMIIEEIDRRYREDFPHSFSDWQSMLAATVVLWDGKVRMANLAVMASYSVNGVSRLHSEILKKDLLRAFYQLYPQKFNNKTNGVSHRRFLAEANPGLADLITGAIGDGWMGNAKELERLRRYEDDPGFLDRLAQVKRENKVRLAEYVWRNHAISLNPNSIFDVQVKRMHAYKRQLLNVLKIMDVYNRLLEEPGYSIPPHTFLFAGKASQSYSFAKSVIKLINSLADIINHDQRVNETIKVVFLENFSVSLAQRVYPAADISEQISTAGMEASGTGNMKFMFNGAVTLGTLDGANIEMMEHMGAENMKIFGLTAREIELYHQNQQRYNAWEEYKGNPRLQKVVDQLQGDFFSGSGAEFWEVYDSLMRNNDAFFVLKDFSSYGKAWEELGVRYGNRIAWQRMSLHNIAAAGYFSSDRAIGEYSRDIWKNNE